MPFYPSREISTRTSVGKTHIWETQRQAGPRYIPTINALYATSYSREHDASIGSKEENDGPPRAPLDGFRFARLRSVAFMERRRVGTASEVGHFCRRQSEGCARRSECRLP